MRSRQIFCTFLLIGKPQKPALIFLQQVESAYPNIKA